MSDSRTSVPTRCSSLKCFVSRSIVLTPITEMAVKLRSRTLRLLHLAIASVPLSVTLVHPARLNSRRRGSRQISAKPSSEITLLLRMRRHSREEQSINMRRSGFEILHAEISRNRNLDKDAIALSPFVSIGTFNSDTASQSSSRLISAMPSAVVRVSASCKRRRLVGSEAISTSRRGTERRLSVSSPDSRDHSWQFWTLTILANVISNRVRDGSFPTVRREESVIEKSVRSRVRRF